MADDLYAKISDLREELVAVRNSIDDTKDRVSSVETELQEQRVLLERIAEAEGVDTNLADGQTDREGTGEDATDTPPDTTEAAQE